MEEVPGSEQPLLALDDQPALTGQNEEGLLIRLGVIDAALAGLEHGHIDPELRELDRRFAVLVREPARRSPRLRREPLGIAHVDDEPALRDRGEPGASVLKARFGHEPDSRRPSDTSRPAPVFGNGPSCVSQGGGSRTGSRLPGHGDRRTATRRDHIREEQRHRPVGCAAIKAHYLATTRKTTTTPRGGSFGCASLPERRLMGECAAACSSAT